MAATYTPDATEHGLSAAAQALDAARLGNEILAAETALGLTGTAFSGDDAERAKLAVARQVNLQVRLAQDGHIKAESKGRQSTTYVTRNGERLTVDSVALAIVTPMLGPSLQNTVGEAVFRW